jgi:hypothetical protein
MTVYDVAAIVIILGTVGILVFAGFLALIGHKRAARIVFRGLAICTIAYIGTWAAMTAVAKQKPLGVCDPQCIDSWCLAVEHAKAPPHGHTNVYDVTLCLFSRAERTRTSFGAHAAASETTDVYLVDDRGTRYDALPHDSETSLNVSLKPGQAVRTHRVFELPADAHNIGLLAASGSFGACPMIGECSTSHRAADYLVASGVYRKGSGFLALVSDLRRNAARKPPEWR